ncbi:MAG: hypothetical protein E7544_02745 [Ruminococcaceae bacterium]|nr:hypothetical protein [Oscillospiraceae bacterium]
MAKKIRRNGFVEGAVISYAAIVITKLLGAFYNIPFYSIIGEKGSVIYSFAYSIYTLFLDISTSGIPIAISIVISEYAAKEMYRTKERAYKLGLGVVTVISFLAFAVLMIFAPQVAGYYIGDMTDGVTVQEVAPAIRAIAFCLLIVPFLSMRRGYLQGHKCVAVSSTSQVTEQFVRILVVLAGAYLAIHVFDFGVTAGVCVSLLGAAIGALVAYIHLKHKEKGSSDIFHPDTVADEKVDSDKVILKKLLTYCSVITIIAIASGLYNLIDMKLLLVGLEKLSYSDESAQLIAGLASTWIPKICMIVTALAMGMTNSIAPHVAENYASGNLEKVNFNLNQAISTIFAVATPIASGMIIFARPVFHVFYGESPYGSKMLQWALVLNVFVSVVSVISMAMQSMNMGKVVCIATVLGIVINTCLDLPFIYLFDKIGIDAYLGATAASITGEIATLTMLLAVLKKKHKFHYSPSIKVLLKTFVAVGVMVVAVLGLCFAWPVKESGIVMYLQVALFGGTGALIFFLISYKSGLVIDVLGQNNVDRVFSILNRVLVKLHLKKS